MWFEFLWNRRYLNSPSRVGHACNVIPLHISRKRTFIYYVITVLYIFHPPSPQVCKKEFISSTESNQKCPFSDPLSPYKYLHNIWTVPKKTSKETDAILIDNVGQKLIDKCVLFFFSYYWVEKAFVPGQWVERQFFCRCYM